MNSRIRNFCIIAHIDHGKSTLSDRFLDITGTISKRESREQMLDMMDLERERGITIKSQAVRMHYKGYELNLIDTPGHVDFTYEVSRSLKACEGALLLVDATQGIEAQTVANMYMALEQDLHIIPVINKIDMVNANVSETKEEIINLIGCKEDEIYEVSAKTGLGVDALLDAIIREIPEPAGTNAKPLKALVFDSKYDPYRGVIVYVRLFEGKIKAGDEVFFMENRKYAVVYDVGIFSPEMRKVNQLVAGGVGYIITGLKDIAEIRVGDTVTLKADPADQSLPGFEPIKPMVFCGLFPVINDKYEELKKALERYRLNDAAFSFEPDSSTALGFGFRCGYLGLLHMEIVQERVEREYGIDLIATAPNVRYKVTRHNGEHVFIKDPAKFPEESTIEKIEEPYANIRIISPAEYVGNLMKLLLDARAQHKNLVYISKTRVILEYEVPLAEIMFDFYDKLKSLSRGYASVDYDFIGYRQGDLVRVKILIAGEPVDSLSFIVARSKAYHKSVLYTKKLKELIPRHLFEVSIQAAIGSRIITRENVRAMRKNVTAKCYGGDITRKRKLLERQKEGKKRMKQVGRVSIPQEAFLAVLSLEDAK